MEKNHGGQRVIEKQETTTETVGNSKKRNRAGDVQRSSEFPKRNGHETKGKTCIYKPKTFIKKISKDKNNIHKKP